MPARSSWRDLVKVHPAADLFPMMADDDLAALGKDIMENGLKQRVTLWTPESVITLRSHRRPPKELYLIDGRNRLAAIELSIADPVERWGYIESVLDPKSRSTPATLLAEDQADPWSYVISANIHRRHLTGEQKRELIDTLLKAKPERSDRATAKIARTDNKTVASRRADLVTREEIPHVETRRDSAGRDQPAHKPAIGKLSVPRAPRSGPRPSLVRDTTIVQFSMLLHAKPKETLDDLGRMLRNEQAGIIAKVQVEQRVALARGYLAALGVCLDDLKPAS